MKCFTLRLMVATITFFAGIGIVAIWLINRSVPVSEISSPSFDCLPVFDHNIHPYEYGSEENAVWLIAFEELPLGTLPACVDESYRLLWSPTFHQPTVVHLWRSGDRYFIATKRLSGMGGYGVGSLEYERTRSLTESEWLSFINLINRVSYWETPSIIDEPVPMDGAGWKLEGLNGRNYHFVYRISPSEELREIIRHIFNLTDIETEHERYLP